MSAQPIERRYETEVRLSNIEEKLDRLTEVLERIAVQGQQISELQKDNLEISRKISQIEKDLLTTRLYQASCPRYQIKFLWLTVVPISLTLLGVLFTLLKGH